MVGLLERRFSLNLQLTQPDSRRTSGLFTTILGLLERRNCLNPQHTQSDSRPTFGWQTKFGRQALRFVRAEI